MPLSCRNTGEGFSLFYSVPTWKIMAGIREHKKKDGRLKDY
jgi:hypothetical protein